MKNNGEWREKEKESWGKMNLELLLNPSWNCNWKSLWKARWANNGYLSYNRWQHVCDKHVECPVSSNWELLIDIIHHRRPLDRSSYLFIFLVASLMNLKMYHKFLLIIESHQIFFTLSHSWHHKIHNFVMFMIQLKHVTFIFKTLLIY